MNIFKRRFAWIAGAVGLVGAFALTIENVAPAATSGSESAGSQLFDDLDPSLFGPPPAQAPPARPDFQKRILPDVLDDAPGEDLGAASPNAPLARVERNMRSAAAYLPAAESLPRASELQRQVVAELDALIEQLAKQCCSGACQPGDQPKPPSQRSQASAPKPGAKPGRGNAPARDSNSQLRLGDPEAVRLGEREELMKDLWGHLPPQIREQMLQSYSDEFLPEYELEIERYFRRLAEEPAIRHAE
jgi:hypothetical protein